MTEINELIKLKISKYPKDVQELAIETLKMVDLGLSKQSIIQKLESVLRQIVKRK